ncbi:hypothetical protein PanWU01x14_184160 [Parasponia andersonii]|uniref:Uncharacterized protein n=1 Tax=Parasponia andersonii TaxID=3476 RepID=A0A2P5C4T0_PARAD|nr:hypothetical protein PanWU01x14_184160 [Parasponia andersonii]
MGKASILASSPFFFFNFGDILGEHDCGGRDPKSKSFTPFVIFEVQWIFSILCDRLEQVGEMRYLGLWRGEMRELSLIVPSPISSTFEFPFFF